ncbi:terminase TerL endonuclease subunit [Lawsonibacter sp. LCP25S3_G6]|uniref:ParB/RepB/Spo0J family partition protein n=1 Tax=unclassified Lawsonibacter TaxID=2617946 RepID=UPI003F9B6F85
MKGFDLGSFLAQQETVSKLDTSAGRERYERIDIDLLDPDPENFYSMDGLEELAENILLCGLLQPIRVKPGEMSGRFTVMAGHRRRAALRLLVDGGHEEFRLVPCIRDGGGSDTLQELKLIYANSDSRELTAAEQSKQALKIEMLLYRLQEEGYQFSGRMRDRVAEICKISASKLARLKVIREGLIPAYMELFEKDELSEQTAYVLARLPGEFQERLNRVLAEPPSGAKAEKLLAMYNDGWRWEPELTCPDGKSCKRGDAFLRRDCESPGWSGMCGGNTCCLNCDMARQVYSPCERMCSKARAVRKEKSDQKKAAEHERMVKAGRKYQKETERNAMLGMSPATKKLELLIREHKMLHEHNTCARYCFGNVRCAVDGNENMKPMKNQSRGRIDITVAWIIAMAAAMLKEQQKPDLAEVMRTRNYHL